MSILNLLQLSATNCYDTETTLRKPSSNVVNFDLSFQNEVDDLLETFHSWKIAVGISAPQVGIQKRFALVNLDKSAKPQDTLILINPKIQSESGKKEVKKESCLSIPNLRGDVTRRYKIHITYQDRNGERKQLGAEGFLARVIMHEIDHLDGILFIDRMSSESILEQIDIPWE